MVVKLLKDIDYYKLVVLIYKSSSLDSDLLELLFNYVVVILQNSSYDKCYVDKLMVDCNIFEVSYTNPNVIELRLRELLGSRGFIVFRGALFDMVNRGYFC